MALLTTTRYVYSHLNYNLNTNFINSLFEKIDGRNPTLGDVFLQTKVLSGTSINSNKFTLLGDPMMSLSISKVWCKNYYVSRYSLAFLGKIHFYWRSN